MRLNSKRNTSKEYYKFHGAKGHDDKDCFRLRNAIEDTIRWGCNPVRPAQRRRKDDDNDDEKPMGDDRLSMAKNECAMAKSTQPLAVLP